MVLTAYLGMPVFRRLLEKAEEEFEFDYADGALTIPCDTEAFKYILVVMDRHQKGLVVVEHGTLAHCTRTTHVGLGFSDWPMASHAVPGPLISSVNPPSNSWRLI